MMKVWPAAVAARPRGSRRHAGDRQRGGREASRSSRGTTSTTPRRSARRSTTSTRAELKPYFELDNMIAGAFWMAGELYGLSFTEITGKVPVFSPDVRVWEVKDKASGKYVGLFYGDYFARAIKRSGAWASGYQGHESFTGKTVTPIMSNNNNFVKGARDGAGAHLARRRRRPCSTSSDTRCTGSCPR